MVISLKKMIGRDEEHISRFHTRKGDLAMPGTLPSLVASIVGRVAPKITKENSRPWMSPGAIDALADLIHRDLALLELGSGRSTKWYAARAARVVAVEPNPVWAASVRAELAGVRGVTLIEGSICQTLPRITQNCSFDLAIVDHSDEEEHSRLDSIEFLARSPQPPGIIVLDDSDRVQYGMAKEILSGWDRREFRGFRSAPLSLTQTTVWVRPG